MILYVYKHLFLRNFNFLNPNSFSDREIKTYLEKQFNIEPLEISNIVKFNYYTLPYIDHFSKTTKQKLNQICDQYCKDLSVKIVFTPFKVVDVFSVKICDQYCKDFVSKNRLYTFIVGDLFSVKNAIFKILKSFVVYKFVCLGCNASYIGETTRHLSTRIEENLDKDK